MRVQVIIEQEGNGLFKAACPTLPGCVAFGHTRTEAQASLQDAILGYLYSLDVAVPEHLAEEAMAV